MSTFTIDMSSPFPSGSFTRGLGGPNSGGHHGADWYIRFGMDLGAPAGTEVHAAFDGHITVLHPHNPAKDSAKVYGRKSSCGSRLRRPRRASQTIRWAASIPTSPMCRVRSTSGHGSAGGDLLGKIYAPAGAASHLHLALVEIIGGAPGGRYTGVDIYQNILDIANTATVLSVAFKQDGSSPTVT